MPLIDVMNACQGLAAGFVEALVVLQLRPRNYN
jgi:hypothetical protein